MALLENEHLIQGPASHKQREELEQQLSPLLFGKHVIVIRLGHVQHLRVQEAELV